MPMNNTVPSGLILLNKKTGITSFDALGAIKRGLGTGKVGHTGTLDKFAQGLMLVLAGRALKLSPWFSHCDKQYLGGIRFGVETDTLDPEGKPVAEAPLPSREQVEEVLSQFTGGIMQAPPAYSAIHINGKRASALARSGEAPVMKERPVHIYRLELRSWAPPTAEIYVHCSSGTYIRSLARDIALAAGSRAHLCSLVRTQIAGFRLEDAWEGIGDQGSGIGEGGQNFLRPIDKSVIGALSLPWFEVGSGEAQQIIHGKPLSAILDEKALFPQGEASALSAGQDYSAAVFFGGAFAAIVEKNNGKWKYGCVDSGIKM